MGNLVPSVLLYSQAAELLSELKEAQESGSVKDTNDLIQELTAILTNFDSIAGRPMLNYEPIDKAEPPSSEKTNRFWARAEKDINILRQQVDMLRASTMFSYNLVSTELANAREDNGRLNNKLKSLQMYSDKKDSNIVTFSDSFSSLDFVDVEATRSTRRVSLPHYGHITLGQEGDLINLSEQADIRVLSASSNGFLGNNQELNDPTQSPVDSESGNRLYTFKSEVRTYDDTDAITDEEPNTWIEYEKYSLTRSQKLSAHNYNFTYKKVSEDGNEELIDWAEPPEGGVLKLGLEFDFKKTQHLNAINFTPYGLEDNSNYPVLIRQIQTSPNGTDWTRVFPTNVWVGTDINLRAARAADHVVTGKAVWAFEARPVQYVRVFIEQHNSVQSNVGHSYWVERKNPETRAEGPIPPVEDPTKYRDTRAMGDLLQRRQHFVGKRWAIGIRDLLMQQVNYKTESVMITKPLRVGGIVDRVTLDSADIQIPDMYAHSDHWIRFYITPDDGENWYQISRIEDTYNSIPEIISFNDPLHESLRERSVANYVTETPVTALRLKVELSRPADLNSTTPVLKSYVLKVRRR